MAAPASMLDDVLALAKGTHALTEEQLARVLRAAPKMTPEDLEKLKAAILKIREMEIVSMKKKLAVYKKAAAAYQEWQADKARKKLTQEETASKADEGEALQTLLTKL